ncbi:hypothetical protein [Bradyrhizobium sp. 2TAF24]|uniref:hypothetical protein n=1 Tax=Bradyrhizobium sp. 2TAF24 TaxID=3233011 RepID=UPI003F914E84
MMRNVSDHGYARLTVRDAQMSRPKAAMLTGKCHNRSGCSRMTICGAGTKAGDAGCHG